MGNVKEKSNENMSHYDVGKLLDFLDKEMAEVKAIKKSLEKENANNLCDAINARREFIANALPLMDQYNLYIRDGILKSINDKECPYYKKLSNYFKIRNWEKSNKEKIESIKKYKEAEYDHENKRFNYGGTRKYYDLMDFVTWLKENYDIIYAPVNVQMKRIPKKEIRGMDDLVDILDYLEMVKSRISCMSDRIINEKQLTHNMLFKWKYLRENYTENVELRK